MTGDVVLLSGETYEHPQLGAAASILSVMMNTDGALIVVPEGIFHIGEKHDDDDYLGAEDEIPVKSRMSFMTPTVDGERLLSLLPHLSVAVLIAVPSHALIPPNILTKFFGSFPSFRRDRHVSIATLKAAAGWPVSDSVAEQLVSLFPDPAGAAALLENVPRLVVDTPSSASTERLRRKDPIAVENNRLLSSLTAGLRVHVASPSLIRPKQSTTTFYRELISCDEAPILFEKGPRLLAAQAKIALTGPAGTGKSQAATAICAAMGCESMDVRSSDILAYRLGAMERNLAKVFQAARDHGNMVIVLDEFDSMGSSRAQAGSASYIVGLTNALLIEFDAHTLPIIIISNFFHDRIDEALRRRIDVVATFRPIPRSLEERAWQLILGFHAASETIGETVISDYAHARKLRALTGDGSY